MAKIKYGSLNLKTNIGEPVIIKIGSKDVKITQYLPIEDKAALIEWVADCALDINTGVYSPLRLETYFYIALTKWYADIEFTDKQLENVGKIYDTLVTNDVINNIIGAIPEDEFDSVYELLMDTVDDAARYNSSFAGMIRAISGQSDSMNTQITDILEKIKNREGIELLSEIKNINGN